MITGYPYEFKNAIAGKTGTTQNQSDGWLWGYAKSGYWSMGWWGGQSVHFEDIALDRVQLWLTYLGSVYEKCIFKSNLGISDEKFQSPRV